MNDWDVVHPSADSSKEDLTNQLDEGEELSTHAKVVEHLISEFAYELKIAHKEKYDVEKAEKTAALCLDAQKEIAEFLAEAELLAKEKKSEVESLEAEKFFYYKKEAGTKLSDVAANLLVAKDSDVKIAKRAQYTAEADYNKWKNLFGTLKEGHVFFRGLAKGKSEWT
jgi:hypothetical protein